MPDVRKSYIGLGAGTFGETVAGNATSIHYFRNANETLGGGERVAHVRNEYDFGAAVPRSSVVAARDYSGNINVPNVSMLDMAKAAKFAFGTYTVTLDEPSIGQNRHTFDILEGPVGGDIVLPSATAILGVGGVKYFDYVGGQCGTFGISSSAENHNVSMSTSWMFRDRLNATATVPVYTASSQPLLWRSVFIRIDDELWPEVDSFDFSLNQGLSGHRQANQSATIAYYERSTNVEINLSLGLRYTGGHHGKTLAGTYHAVNIKIFDNAALGLVELSFPKVQFENAEATISGRIPQSLTARAYRDDVTGRAMRLMIFSPETTY